EISLLAGVTTFRDLGGPLEKQGQLRDAIEAGDKKGPRLFLAGPTVKQATGKEGEGRFVVGSRADAENPPLFVARELRPGLALVQWDAAAARQARDAGEAFVVDNQHFKHRQHPLLRL
ncbi:MAG: hypothetical protein MJK04_05830, partial [Psychrosphaera sp.]|nr:hypothetical protein [Psychrosphaera sp.]